MDRGQTFFQKRLRSSEKEGNGQYRASEQRTRRFNNSLLEFAATLNSTRPEKIDREINRLLSLAGQLWGFDQIVLGEFSYKEQSRIVYTPLHRGIQHAPSACAADVIPWLTKRILRGRTAKMIRLPNDLPCDAITDRDFCLSHGIGAALALPFKVAGSIRGCLIFGSHHKECAWADDHVNQLHFVASIVASALERKRLVARIDELCQIEQLLGETSVNYINLPFDRVENMVRTDLGRLGRLLGVDRCMLYLNRGDKGFSLEMPLCWWPDQDANDIKAVDEVVHGMADFVDSSQYLVEKWLKGDYVRFTYLNELPRKAEKMKRLYSLYGVKSGVSVPILAGGSAIGALDVTTTRTHRSWPEDVVTKLQLFGQVFANALARKRSEGLLHKTISELKELKERTEADYRYLTEENRPEHFGDIVGKSNALKNIFVKVKQVAPTDVSVLILGETGTGKELVARAIHDMSTRKDRPLIQVNCAALTPSLIESELFGHEKGAFTGAATRRIGRFELAHGTTLFLDEIGELPLDLQAKLLRVLQDGEFERVGGNATIKSNIRLISATNRDIEKEVTAGRFRKDLWYRLSIFPIRIPPLRERQEDIPLLVNFFAGAHGRSMGRRFKLIPEETVKALQTYSWPGNVRELENLVERAVITSHDGELHIEVPGQPNLPFDDQNPMKRDGGRTLIEVEREHILKVLRNTRWRIDGPKGAARRLGLNASTLRSRVQKLEIKRPV